jgi:tRNA (cytidine/uridine-2'-O-)-methyltransferase
MLHVVLYQPEIPPNTGNVIRLCANTGAHLHLIRPLGFELDDRRLRRAGLDYHEWSRAEIYDDLEAFRTQVRPKRLLAFTTRGRVLHTGIEYRPGDALLFGPETRGLPPTLLSTFDPAHLLRLPMRPEVRSLNLSNAVAVAVYEAWRQLGFEGGG